MIINRIALWFICLLFLLDVSHSKVSHCNNWLGYSHSTRPSATNDEAEKAFFFCEICLFASKWTLTWFASKWTLTWLLLFEKGNKSADYASTGWQRGSKIDLGQCRALLVPQRMFCPSQSLRRKISIKNDFRFRWRKKPNFRFHFRPMNYETLPENLDWNRRRSPSRPNSFNLRHKNRLRGGWPFRQLLNHIKILSPSI